MPFDSPVLSWCNGWSPGTSVTLLKLWWETQQSFLHQTAIMDELDYLYNLNELQVLSHATSCDKEN